MISLCMITLNEEKFIADCLRAAKPAADEIIVVDTGSTDRTVAIAREHGAWCGFFPWRDDFSAARNEALGKAQGDWILVLDADEHLEDGAAGLIREAVAAGSHSGYFLPLISLLDGGRRAECLMMRLFVNRPGIRYRYLIHEQVLPDLTHYARRAGQPLGTLPARIIHKGYQTSVLEDRDKIERNRRIFRRQFALYPRDAYSWYKYADFLRRHGAQGPEVLDTLRQAHALLDALPDRNARTLVFAGEVAALLGLEMFLQEEDLEGALSILRDAARRFAPTPHLFYIKAGLEKELRLFLEAVKSYERCLAFRGQDFMVPVTEGVTSWLSLNGIGQCLLEAGEPDRARPFLEESLGLAPDQVVAYAALAEAAHRQGDGPAAMRWLMRLLERRPGHGPAWQAGSEILERMGLCGRARLWRKKAAEAGAVSEPPLESTFAHASDVEGAE